MTGTVRDSTSLIIRQLADRAPQVASELPVESAFLTGKGGQLQLQTHKFATELKALFSHAIARNPNNLRVHVQRILLYAESGDPNITGPLCDLFLVLREKGAPLRKRMLALARPLLNPQNHQTLQRLLNTNENHIPTLRSLCARSRLSDGITGTTQLITRRDARTSTTGDPLEAAREQLDTGQADLAQQTLENAILADPARLELHLALLEIYRHARDLQHIDAFWRQLPKAQNPATSQWQQLLEQLGGST